MTRPASPDALLHWIEERRVDVMPTKDGGWAVFEFRARIYGEGPTVAAAVDDALDRDDRLQKLIAETEAHNKSFDETQSNDDGEREVSVLRGVSQAGAAQETA